MIGFRFLKVPPTTYVMQYRGGNIVREGGRLSFFYFAPMATVVQVSVASTDVPFVFNEISSDFQEATIQGQLTYRISDPKKTAAMLDFSLRSDAFSNRNSIHADASDSSDSHTSAWTRSPSRSGFKCLCSSRG
jgi:hypothetical protein